MASLVGKNIGNYRVVAQVGHGGMGAVFLGEHPLIGKRVAIKVLHDELAMKEDIVSRFFTEAKAVNDIKHPNIVDIVDFGKIPADEPGRSDVVYFIMEYLDGEGLNSRLKREGISMNDAVHVVTQCASALSASHKKHIVHRDIKPENIYLVARGQDKNYVKILDFGIAKLTGDDAGASKHQTRAGLVIGTPAYMSPEQCEGKGNIDWRSDIYSLGVVLFEMLTGRTPFQGDGFGEVLVAHLTKTPPLPSSIRHEIPPGLDSVVMHSLEKSKDTRFQNMEEFQAALADPNAHLAAWNAGHAMGTAGTMMMDGGRPVTGQGQRPITGQGQGQRPITGQGQGQRPITGQGSGATAIASAPAITGQHPTTLSGSAGEVASDGSTSTGKRTLWSVGGGLAAAAIALGVYFLAFDKPPEEAPHIVAATTPGPPKIEVTHIKIDTLPKGAKAYRAGVKDPIGVTPFELKMKRGESEFDVILKLDGYEDQSKTVSTKNDHDILLQLAPAKVAATASADKPKPKESDSKDSAKESGSKESAAKESAAKESGSKESAAKDGKDKDSKDKDKKDTVAAKDSSKDSKDAKDGKDHHSSHKAEKKKDKDGVLEPSF